MKSKVVTGDVVAVLRRLPSDQRFDLIIADPPYNIGKDFGNESDRMPIDAYVHWSQSWIDLCLARLTDNGLLYVYGFPEILARIAARYPYQEQKWLVWHYTNKNCSSPHFWQRSHESILCLWRPGNGRPKLEVDQIREPYTQGFLVNAGKKRAATPSRLGGSKGRETTYHAHPQGALPRDVIKVPALAGGAGAAERWFQCRDCGGEVRPPSEMKAHRGHDILKHPTQKPRALTRRLIQSRINSAPAAMLVPFAGSGAECVAAQELGVPFIGIEINPEFARFARSWLRRQKRGA